MSLKFKCSNPQDLLDRFNSAIDQEEKKGKITTWERSKDKIYYTHKSEEWNCKAWFKPSIYNGEIVFNIIKPKNSAINSVVYAYYHGHLTETFLTHFDNDFTTATSTALAEEDDIISS